jgi:hypothetical protein
VTTVLETRAYRAPLALSVTDAATGAALADGLIAMAWPAGDPSSARPAQRSMASRLLGFHTLPGLRQQEYASARGDAAPQWPALPSARFVVAVADTQNRYLPQTLVVNVPVTAPVAVGLYSAPARRTPSGWARVSGEVRSSAAPVPWAVVEVSDGTTTFRTTSDTAGRYVLCLPYPEALPGLSGTPPVGSGIGDVTWPLTISVKAQPSAIQFPAGPGPADAPDISSVLAQGDATITAGGGSHPSVPATLAYGVALTVALDVIPA